MRGLVGFSWIQPITFVLMGLVFASAGLAAGTTAATPVASDAVALDEPPASVGPDRFEQTNPIERKKKEREIAERVRKILAGVEGRDGAAGSGGSGNPSDGSNKTANPSDK